MSSTTRRGLAIVLTVAIGLGACGGGDDDGEADAPTDEVDDTATTAAADEPTTTTAAVVDEAADRAIIEQMTTEFFRLLGTGNQEEAVPLLENGADYLDEMLHCADLTATAEVVMKDVQFTDPDHAITTYDILLNGAVVLADSGGSAVRVDGEWLVAENTFLSLYDAASDSCTGPPPTP